MGTSHLARTNSNRPPICSYVLGNHPLDAFVYLLSISAKKNDKNINENQIAIVKENLTNSSGKWHSSVFPSITSAARAQ